MTIPRLAICSQCGREVYDDELFKHVQRVHPDFLVTHEHVGGYVSSLCLHGLCSTYPDRCRETCKYCGAFCEHACHSDGVLIQVLAAVYREASATCESGLRAVLQELRDRGLLNEVTRCP